MYLSHLLYMVFLDELNTSENIIVLESFYRGVILEYIPNICLLLIINKKVRVMEITK